MTNVAHTLARLTRVELRDIWKTEAQDFTPWLAGDSNLALLSEALGIELELEAMERSVGPFRADILCKDSATNQWVLVENQLERTDHTHLGQLMTYAAGLEAVTIVWIAGRFTDEHRAALDWLNDITDEAVRFFGLEVELWRIGESSAAPKFNIVSKPNDWTRSAHAGKKAVEEGELSPIRQLQLEYWTGVQGLLRARNGTLKSVTPQPYQWMSHGIGKTAVGLNFAINTRDGSARVEVYMSGRTAKTYFHQLRANRTEIETACGAALDWQELPDKMDCRICDTLHCDVSNKSDWPRQHTWLADRAQKMFDAFRPLVLALEKDWPEGNLS